VFRRLTSSKDAEFYTILYEFKQFNLPSPVGGKDHNGKEAVDEGVALIDYLRLAAVSLGEYLGGKNLSLYLIVEANMTGRVTLRVT
jgi:hypothetical protein